MNKKQIFFIALIFLTAIPACIVPGVQDASGTAPTADTGLLSTIVAETVSGALAQTEQAARLALGPSQTPTPDGGISGSVIRIREDSSTLYMDQHAGYEIIIPFGWLAVRVNEQEYQDSFSLAVTANEHLQASLLSIKFQDPDVFRLFAFDVREDHVQKEFVTNINFVWDEQYVISLDTDEQLKASAAQNVETLPGLEILATTISATTGGIPIGLIDSRLPAQSSSGDEIVIFQKQVVFNVSRGSIAITVSTVEQLKDAVFLEIDAMLETIKLTPR